VGRARLDVIGLALLAPALAGILLGLSNLSEDGGIDHAGVLVPLLAGVALLGAFAGPHTSLWLLGAVLVIRGFGIGTVLVPPMSVAYQDVPRAGIPHATMNTRIAQQVGASFGIAIVAVALQFLLAQGATSAFQGAFWWATGITVAALIPALALPAARAAGGG
jgi:hypothetical protein